MQLSNQLTGLPTVGKKIGASLKRLGLITVEDLLYYFPFRYEDFSKTFIIDELEEGHQVTIKGTIETIASKRSPRKRMIITEAIVADESGRLRVTWFGQPFISKVLKAGDVVYLSGKITGNAFGLQMA
jgi:ATP-dependent DNA helicase RecG